MKTRINLAKGAWIITIALMLTNAIYDFFLNRRLSLLSVFFFVVFIVYLIGLLKGKAMMGDLRVRIAALVIGLIIGIVGLLFALWH
jgi:fumarate reductase subunit C